MTVICMDIGGTKINAGLMDQAGHVHFMLQQPTDKVSLLEQIKRIASQLIAASTTKMLAIGIGTAGRVDFERGIINYATSNLPGWSGTNVKEAMQAEFALPTVVDNDGNCAAVAEGALGAGRDYQDYVCITLGTGVGAGIAAGGSIVRGVVGGAGEIGHMTFYPDGRECNCGKKGCWEQYVSGTALRNEIEKVPALKALNADPAMLFKLADTLPEAKEIVDPFIKQLSIGINSLQNIIDPACIVIGGGMIHSAEAWWHKLVDNHNQNGSASVLKQAELGNHAGMIGAGLLAYEAIGIKV